MRGICGRWARRGSGLSRNGRRRGGIRNIIALRSHWLFIGARESGIFRALASALSSAVEHHLDMVVVSGSIPLARTILTLWRPKGWGGVPFDMILNLCR